MTDLKDVVLPKLSSRINVGGSLKINSKPSARAKKKEGIVEKAKKSLKRLVKN